MVNVLQGWRLQILGRTDRKHGCKLGELLWELEETVTQQESPSVGQHGGRGSRPGASVSGDYGRIDPLSACFST